MRIFKSKRFAKFAEKEGIHDVVLCGIVGALEAGKIDADYGGGVIKQRVARVGSGKSGGYRTIILFRKAHRTFFVYGFAKSDMSNIDAGEERAFKELAKQLFAATESQLQQLTKAGKFLEVPYHESKNV